MTLVGKPRLSGHAIARPAVSRQVTIGPDGPARPGVERLRPLLAALGDPHKAVRAVHVGGTNGKGSVCAMLAGILRAGGLRAGRYTSPHLETATERLWFDGADITDRAFESLMAEVRAAVRLLEERGELPVPLSEFDVLTAAAFYWFASQEPDVVVVEVGLGGRVDATNVLESPLLSILTNVSPDHTEVLGTDEEAIALEKSGIIKDGRPVLTQTSGLPYQILARVARAHRSHLKQVDSASYVSPLPAGQRAGYRGRLWELGLLGTYQLHNAALVLEAVELLRAEGFDISPEAVRQGLVDVAWPGRMEFLETKGERWLFDGAHNAAGAVELAASLRRHCPGEEPVLVFGTLRDKPAVQMIRHLAPLARTAILTSVPSERTFAPEQLASEVRHADLRVIPDPTIALAEARQCAGGRLILVCGSLYLVGLARARARA